MCFQAPRACFMSPRPVLLWELSRKLTVILLTENLYRFQKKKQIKSSGIWNQILHISASVMKENASVVSSEGGLVNC